MTNAEYKLLDSGDQKRLELLGPYKIVRPCAQAVWKKTNASLWKNIDLRFTREKENLWENYSKIPNVWKVKLKNLNFKITPTNFGHLGIFPEHLDQLESLKPLVKRGMKILNLFAYTGAATLFFADLGAKVTHLDASKTSVKWAKENAKLNNLDDKPIRWIVDDAIKFLKREIKRNSYYDAVILDPPSYGRGASSQVFKIEEDIHTLLGLCRDVLNPDPAFVFFSCHTPGFTKQTMLYLMQEYFKDLKFSITSGEMLICAKDTHDLPSGSFGLWSRQ